MQTTNWAHIYIESWCEKYGKPMWLDKCNSFNIFRHVGPSSCHNIVSFIMSCHVIGMIACQQFYHIFCRCKYYDVRVRTTYVHLLIREMVDLTSFFFFFFAIYRYVYRWIHFIIFRMCTWTTVAVWKWFWQASSLLNPFGNQLWFWWRSICFSTLLNIS